MRAHPRGAPWERLAERHLQDRGLTTLVRNFHCRLGEVDLIMRDGDATVFVEVRYRRNEAFGTAAETVNHRKRQRMQRAAGLYLGRFPERAAGRCRFDVVGITGSTEAPRIQWLPGAFEAA